MGVANYGKVMMRGFIFAFMFALAACGAGTSDHDAKAEELAKLERWMKEANEKQAKLNVKIERLHRENASSTSCDTPSLQEIAFRVESDTTNTPDPLKDDKKERNRETFGALLDMVGMCYRGIPVGGSTERKPDIQHWQWALGDTAILIRHALEDGSYGGDTYIYKDAESGKLVYVYITNAGFRTEGVIELSDDSGFTAEEAVTGHPTITKVRSISSFKDDGSIHVASELFEDGQWGAGHAFTYNRTSTPPVLRSVSDTAAEP
jgi:hypothetical protein